jgi:PAS domain-containing protein
MAPAARPTPRFEARILRLVQGPQERRALVAGEIDAVIDASTGQAILLPDAQNALLGLKRHFRSLLNLACDGHWSQGVDFRFTTCSGAALLADSIGKCLWELDFESGGATDWREHRAQLSGRQVFRDLELCLRDGSGQRRHISVSGEPSFDVDGHFNGYRGIVRDITARKLAESTHGGDVERATLNALAAPACLLDADGVIMASNAAWRAWAELPGGGVAVGSHYLRACREFRALVPFDSEAVAAGLAQVSRGERAVFRFEHGFESAHGPRWLTVSASALRAPGIAYLMLVHEDISEQKRSAQWLALERTVAMRLARAADTPTALSAVLAAVCEAQLWDCGQYFAHDASSASLDHVAQWSDVRATEVESFLARSPLGRVRSNAGLAGRVCEAQQPLWLRDVQRDARAAVALPHEIGLRGLFIFPVSADDVLHGVMVFGSRAELNEPDESCLRAVANIGNLLGHFLRRDAEHERLRHSEQRYARYTALGCDWHFETDKELRFTSSTATGIAGVSDILGKRLWELPHLRVSDEEWTRLKAELAAQWSFCDFACSALLPDGREARYLLSGEPVFDDAGVFSGFLGIGLDVTQRLR